MVIHDTLQCFIRKYYLLGMTNGRCRKDHHTSKYTPTHNYKRNMKVPCVRNISIRTYSMLWSVSSLFVF